jgi:hypothetical protein
MCIHLQKLHLEGLFCAEAMLARTLHACIRIHTCTHTLQVGMVFHLEGAPSAQEVMLARTSEIREQIMEVSPRCRDAFAAVSCFLLSKMRFL